MTAMHLQASPRMRQPRRLGAPAARQRGVTLIELMVSIAIGLLTIAVAIGALMVSRGVSSNVSDVSQMQQQAAYAFRVIGQQVRQAGSTELNLAVGKTDPTAYQPDDPVAFMLTGYTAASEVVSGRDAPTAGQFRLSVGYRNHLEPNLANDAVNTLFRDCLGQGGAAAHPLITSAFVLTGNELQCRGTDGVTQTVIRNVADFQVNYLVQQAGVGAPTVQRTNAAGVGTNWPNVFAVEICMDLVGEDRIDLPTSAKYRNCGNAEVTYGGRMHMVFRNTFQIRSQGLLL